MTIKEVARKYGTSVPMLRYYERLGIIPPTDNVDGKRQYRDEDCFELELLRCMSAADMPLDEMIEYVQLRKQGAISKQARLEILAQQRVRMQAKSYGIQQMIDRLNQEIYECSIE